MNEKQNDWMREILFREATRHRPVQARRNVLFVRIDTDWEELVGGVQRQRLEELCPGAAIPKDKSAAFVEGLLGDRCPARAELLREAKVAFSALRMDRRGLNAIGTHFSPMPASELEALSQHAYWQVLATYALYWEPWSTSASQAVGVVPPLERRAASTATA
jgi:hypothetical protein